MLTKAAVIKLSSYNIIDSVATVSGLSGGGFMGVQVHVAFSNVVVGSGIFAGGPYYCATGSLANALDECMEATSAINVDSLVKYTEDQSKAGITSQLRMPHAETQSHEESRYAERSCS
jgi:hypothetical protein